MADEENRWEETIREFQRQDAAGEVPHGQILFVGSSSFTLWNLADYFPRRDLVNRGFGGSQLHEVADLAERYVTPLEPRQIVLYAGDNDLGAGRSPQQVLGAFRLFLTKVRAALPATPILFVSIKPSPSRHHLLDIMREANLLILADIHRGRNLDYVNVFEPMLDAAGEPRPELFAEDKLHLNHEGYLLWAQLIGPQLLPQSESK